MVVNTCTDLADVQQQASTGAPGDYKNYFLVIMKRVQTELEMVYQDPIYKNLAPERARKMRNFIYTKMLEVEAKFKEAWMADELKSTSPYLFWTSFTNTAATLQDKQAARKASNFVQTWENTKTTVDACRYYLHELKKTDDAAKKRIAPARPRSSATKTPKPAPNVYQRALKSAKSTKPGGVLNIFRQVAGHQRSGAKFGKREQNIVNKAARRTAKEQNAKNEKEAQKEAARRHARTERKVQKAAAGRHARQAVQARRSAGAGAGAGAGGGGSAAAAGAAGGGHQSGGLTRDEQTWRDLVFALGAIPNTKVEEADAIFITRTPRQNDWRDRKNATFMAANNPKSAFNVYYRNVLRSIYGQQSEYASLYAKTCVRSYVA